MKKKILGISIIVSLITMLFILTGCGNSTNKGSSDNEDAEVTKVGNLSLELQQINDFSEGLASAKKDGKWGYIDKKGNVVIDFIYEKANDFSEGLASVEKDGKAGYINAKGEVVVDFVYRSTYTFSNGYGVIRDGTYYGVIDKQGNTIIEPNKYMANIVPLSNDLFYVDGGYTGDTNLGYDIIDKESKVIIDGIAGARNLSEGLIAVKQLYINGKSDMQNGKWGFIDKDGNMVIDYQYDDANNFSDGLVRVVKDNKYGFIDKNNNVIIEINREYETYFTGMDFCEGLALTDENGKDIYIDTKGEKVFELEDGVSSYGFNEGLAKVEKNDMVGYINKDGKLVVDYKYNSGFDFSDGLAKVYTDDESFEFINSKGKTILAGKIVK